MSNQTSAFSAHKNTDCALREYIAASTGSPLTEAIQNACTTHWLFHAQPIVSAASKPRDTEVASLETSRPVAILIHHCLANASEDRREGRIGDAGLFEVYAKWLRGGW